MRSFSQVADKPVPTASVNHTSTHRHRSPGARAGGDDVVALAEKALALLGEGAFTATYKYAVLLALMDLCLEGTQADGAAPEMVTTRELAERVVAIYWPHCVPYHGASSGGVLRQSLGGRSSQAEIVSLIMRYRDVADPLPSSTPPRGLAGAGTEPRFRRLVDDVEWKLIEMPLPRLQTFGGREDPFLYRIAWDRGVRLREVRAYQRGDGGAFDNRLLLIPGVGDGLVTLNGLLRPLIHREWAKRVARMNGMEEARLEMFLFGQARINLAPVREGAAAGPLFLLRPSPSASLFGLSTGGGWISPCTDGVFR